MKKRNGFVSNSSSSSFICEICGEEVIGQDISLENANMYQCVAGHTICEDHVTIDIESDEFAKKLLQYKIDSYYKSYKKTNDDFYLQWSNDYKQYLKDYDNMDDSTKEEVREDLELRSNIPQETCAICSMKSIRMIDVTSYLLYKFDLDCDKVKEEMALKFATLEEMNEKMRKDKDEKA